METLAYIRVSSKTQNLERQRELVKSFSPAPCRIFEDIMTGASNKRPELDKLLDYCREGDKIIIPSIDRLARSLIDLDKIIKKMTNKGTSIFFIIPIFCLVYPSILTLCWKESKEKFLNLQIEGLYIGEQNKKFCNSL